MKGQNTEQILEAEENCAELTQGQIEFTPNMSIILGTKKLRAQNQINTPPGNVKSKKF